ncbi:hypothetical protein ABLN64_12490, partial [Mycobacterium tuberculosis]
STYFVRFIIWVFNQATSILVLIFAIYRERFRVFRAPLHSCEFRIYRETLSARFSCALRLPIRTTGWGSWSYRKGVSSTTPPT